MKIRKDEDNEIRQIRESFQDLLANVEPIPLSSDSDAEIETTKLLAMLNLNDWNQKSQAIQRSLSLLKGGAIKYQSFNLTEILNCSSLAILDFRPQLVKYGTLLITAASQILADNLVVCADFVIPNLFKQASCGKLSISGCCKYSILSIVQNCQKPRVLKTILSESSSKSPARRLIVAESLVTALQDWPKPVSMSIPDIKNIIANLVADPNQEVRETARSALSLYEGSPGQQQATPRQVPKKPFIENVTPKKSTRKTAQNNSRSNRPKSLCISSSVDQTSMFEIDQVMPPFDEASADRFCKLLMRIIKTESYFVLNGLEFALPKSIIASSKLSSVFGSMVMMIPQLFEIIPDEFRENIAELIISTKINTRIIKRSFEQFGEEAVFDNFIEKAQQFQNETIQFFSEVLRKNLVAKLNDKSESFLTNFLKDNEFVRNSDIDSDINFLNQYLLNSNDSSLSANVDDDIMNKYGNLKSFIIGEKYAQNELQVRNVKAFKKYVVSDVNSLVELLSDSNNLNVNLALTFLLEFFNVCGKEAQLKELYPLLLDLLADPNYTFSGKASACLDSIFCKVDDMFSYIKSEKYQSVSMSFLTKYITSHNDVDQSISQNYTELSNLIKPNLSNENVTLRRHTIIIYAKMSAIIGTNFQSIFSEMSSMHQKMINFYKDKFFSNIQIDI